MFDLIKGLFKPTANESGQAPQNAVIVDVRTKDEFRAGHIEGSMNVPLDSIKKESISLKQLNKPVVTVCHSGNRSAVAKKILAAAGNEDYNGGAWTSLKRKTG